MHVAAHHNLTTEALAALWTASGRCVRTAGVFALGAILDRRVIFHVA